MNKKKWVHPEKRTMNFVRDKSTSTGKKRIVILVLVIVVFVAVMKFGVMDLWQEAWKVKRDYLELEKQVEAVEESASEFDELQAVYRQYDESLIPIEESELQDRMELIKTIERCLLDKADMSSITISGRQINITVVNSSLQKVSDVVQRLKNEDMDQVTVLNAWTEDRNGSTSANISMSLKYMYDDELEGMTEEAVEDEISE